MLNVYPLLGFFPMLLSLDILGQCFTHYLLSHPIYKLGLNSQDSRNIF